MQQNQICAICERQPEDLLVLVCAHNLCVSCATQIFTLNQQSNPFVCQICLAQTQLDQQTIECFRSTTERIPEIDHNTGGIITTKGQFAKKQKKQVNSKPPKSKSPQKKLQTLKNICKIHNQPTLYYCYNCNTVDICSECILTPKHTSHKVVTLKKAHATFQKKIQEEHNALQMLKVNLTQRKQYLWSKKQQLLKCFEKKRLQLKQIFDQIAREVSDKFSQLTIKLQQQQKKSQQIYEAYQGQIEDKQKLLEQSIKINRKISKGQDQSMILQWMNKGVAEAGKQIFSVSLPKEMPGCTIQFFNVDSVYEQISLVLGRIGWIKSENEQSMNYSVIKQQNFHQQPARTVLKQSYKGGINVNKSNSRVGGSSRKLDLSRSIQNATYIINRLQQRSKNT